MRRKNQKKNNNFAEPKATISEVVHLMCYSQSLPYVNYGSSLEVDIRLESKKCKEFIEISNNQKQAQLIAILHLKAHNISHLARNSTG